MVEKERGRALKLWKKKTHRSGENWKTSYLEALTHMSFKPLQHTHTHTQRTSHVRASCVCEAAILYFLKPLTRDTTDKTDSSIWFLAGGMVSE